MTRRTLSGNLWLVAAAAAMLVATTATVDAAATRTCNGSSDYCSLPFDRYTFMGTHNSAAYDLKFSCEDILFCTELTSLVEKCSMNHQSGHDIAKQLSDGIRLFDIDTCVKNNQVFTCRGDANTRAIGPGLHLHLEQVRKFIDSNPNEVIVLNYDDYVNDPEITGNAIVTQLGKYLGGKMLERNDPNAPWPTLGQMISQGKQVVVFGGDYVKHLKNVPKWLLTRSDYIERSQEYTNELKDVDSLVKAFNEHGKNTPSNTKRWQCLDYGYETTFYTSTKVLFSRSRTCLLDTDKELLTKLNDVTSLYSNKFTHVHRVMVDTYYNYLDQLRKMVTQMNAQNVKALHASH